MQHRHCLEAVSRCLQFPTDDDETFNDIAMVFAGDWAQALPVFPQGSIANILNATLCRSELCPQVLQLGLSENMALRRHCITAAHAGET